MYNQPYYSEFKIVLKQLLYKRDQGRNVRFYFLRKIDGKRRRSGREKQMKLLRKRHTTKTRNVKGRWKPAKNTKR